MAAILKNTTNALKSWGGTNISSLGSYNLQIVDTMRILSDENFKNDLTSGNAVINDGFNDLSPMDAMFFLIGFTPNKLIGGTDGTPIGNAGDRLKIDVVFSGDQLLKVSSNDQTLGSLEQKIVGKTNETLVQVLNDGGDEDLEISLADFGTAGTYGSENQIPVFTTDAKGRIQSVINTNINHNTLSNLTSGDPHTQYIKSSGSSTDNAIARYDGITGRIIQNSQVYIDDSGWLSVKTQTPISELTVVSTANISNRGISTLQYSNDINGGKLILGKARGSANAPLYPVNNDVIGLHNFKAWDEATASWANVGYYNVSASENHSSTNKGTNISFWTTPNGTATPQEKVRITNTGRVELTNAITLSNTTETVNGTFRWTGTEAQVRNGSQWAVLGLNATSITGTSSVSTTSSTYSTISGMTTTPAEGTYLLSFNCNFSVGDDTSGDIAVFVGGVEQTIFTRRIGINAAGLVGAVASFESVFSTISFITVNGSQVVDIRYRENGSGTLAITERVLTLIPAYRTT